MKVYAVLALALFAAAAVSAVPTPDEFPEEQISELALIPNDSEEVDKMNPDLKIFRDFCIAARDKVRVYLRESVNSAGANVFNIMFNTINEVANSTLEIQKDAVNEGAEMIKNAHIVKESDETEQSRPQIAAELDQRVKAVRGGLLQTVGESLRLVFNTVIETVSSETAKRLALLKASFNGENVKDKIKEACGDISYNLKNILNSKLKEFKGELLKSTDAASYRDVVAKTKLEDIGCITTGRVNMVNRFCDLLAAAGPIIYPMLGL